MLALRRPPAGRLIDVDGDDCNPGESGREFPSARTTAWHPKPKLINGAPCEGRVSREGAPPATRPAAQGRSLGAVLVVGLAAAGLGEAAADHVADSQDRRVQPCLLGAEAAVVGL